MPNSNLDTRLHPKFALSTPSLNRTNHHQLPIDVELRRSSSAGGAQQKQADELYERLTNRLNEYYRRVQFRVKGNTAADYEGRVSFDTINIEYNEDVTYELSDDDLGILDATHRAARLSIDDGIRGRGRDREFFSGRSPSTSPTRMMSPMRNVDLSFLLSMNQSRYPTRPIITRKGCTLTRMHKDFENLYLGNLLNKGLCPVLPGRVILVYASGRIHTWVSIDWVLRSFIQHGDTVVIVSSLPHSLSAPSSKLSRYSSPAKYRPMTDRMRKRQRNHPQFIKQIAADMMKYALSVINPNIIAKVIVEIAEGKTKDVLKDMYNLYEPNIVSTGSKVNSRNSAPLKSWNSSRLSDRLVKNFPLPVIVTPALNMSFYEKWLAGKVQGDHTQQGSVSLQDSGAFNESPEDTSAPTRHTNMSIIHVPSESTTDQLFSSDEESFSDVSVTSDISANSESSLESASSFHEIADLYDDYQRDVHKELKHLASKKIDENYFSNFIVAISDHSLQFCEDLRSVNPSFKGQGAKLARIITGCNTFGAVPYKTKSLIPPAETKSNSVSNNGISIEDLKKSLRLNAERARQNQETQPLIPQIVVSEESISPPQHRSLKFIDNERSSRRVSRPLKKFLSHEDTTKAKPNLIATKSHPDIRALGEMEDKPKKKKKKKFWKLF